MPHIKPQPLTHIVTQEQKLLTALYFSLYIIPDNDAKERLRKKLRAYLRKQALISQKDRPRVIMGKI